MTAPRHVVIASTLLAMCACRGSGVGPFVTSRASATAITHVRLIDGTGQPAKQDQTVVIQDGRVTAVGTAAAAKIPPGARMVDGRDRTIIPGLVGMHEHLFYQTEGPSGTRVYPAQAAFAKLYLASGVTTIRTAGTLDFDGDLELKAQIDAGEAPGPRIHITGPYLNATSSAADPTGIAREVNAQAERGATSFKAYTSLRTPELRAAIEVAHARGLRVTGHLCAVGFREAIAQGIDNLEHGIVVDSDFSSRPRGEVCQGGMVGEVASLDVATDAGVRQLIADLVRHGTALTSTLAVLESYTGRESAFDPRTPLVLAQSLRAAYASSRGSLAADDAGSRVWSAMLSKEMQFERALVAAGGRLLAGVDPTGWGGIVAGFGDQRELELLVEAGLTPEAAIRFATLNGADFLYESDRVGSVAPGMLADLVLVKGNPSASISDIRNVELVFKDGVAFDPQALVMSTNGTVGALEIRHILRWPYNVILPGLVLLLVARIVSNARKRAGVELTSR